jgi:hypothetical protein
MLMLRKSRFSFIAMPSKSGAPKGEFASNRPIIAASIMTTAALRSDFTL